MLSQRLSKELSRRSLPLKALSATVSCVWDSAMMLHDVRLCETVEGEWYRLMPHNMGVMELPVWVDHVVCR